MLFKKVNPFIFFCFITIPVFAQKKDNTHKGKFGLFVSADLSRPAIKKSNWQQGAIDYRDSLNDIKSKFGFGIDLGYFYQFPIGQYIDLRPSFMMYLGKYGKIEYQKNNANETKKIEAVSFGISIPVLIKIPSTGNRLYASAGPAVVWSPQGNEKVLPFKELSFRADLSIGYDIPINKFFLTPEIKVLESFSNSHKDANNLYTNTISKINWNSIGLSFYFRGK